MKRLFKPVIGSRTGKVFCTICGAKGYPVGRYPRSWQNAHRRGHAPCTRCGKPLTVLRNGKPRTHPHCPTS